MKPGTKVRTTLAVLDSLVDVPQGAEGLVIAFYPQLKFPVEVQLADRQICCYRADELEIIE